MNSSFHNMQKQCGMQKNSEDGSTGNKNHPQKTNDWLELTLGFNITTTTSEINPSNSNLIMAQHGDDDGGHGSSSSSISSSPLQQQRQEMASGFVDSTDQRILGWKEKLHEDDHVLPMAPFPFQSPSSSSLSRKPISVLQSLGSVRGLSGQVLNVNHSTGRPHPAGLWFTLRSTINRNGEVLPQIPKAYIRLKDPNVTVFVVKTYLVGKLALTTESEVEVSCMGQTLVDSETIEYVRDAVWLPKLIEYAYACSSLAPAFNVSQIVHHLMSLDYEKSCSSSINS